VSTLGISIDFDRIREPGFWREIQEQAMGASIPQDAQFDAVIIDEGQDFKQEWFEILRLFLRDDASILWLEDPLQNLRNTDEVELQGFVVYRDSGNFRTPRTIAQFIKDTLELDFTQKNGLPGLGVDVHEYTKKEDQRKIVTHRVSELMRVGFSVDEIALVSCRGMASSAFGTTDRIGSLSIRRFTGDYDKEGEQVYTDGTLLFDTIYRFKGQQAPAVILLDIDESLDQSELARRILYCGMTRATVRLEMLVSAASPWLSPFREAL
jgi:superfamily I DNA and RNA helicase